MLQVFIGLLRRRRTAVKMAPCKIKLGPTRCYVLDSKLHEPGLGTVWPEGGKLQGDRVHRDILVGIVPRRHNKPPALKQKTGIACTLLCRGCEENSEPDAISADRTSKIGRVSGTRGHQ